MNHSLGVYYAPEHSRQSDRDYIAKLQPPVIRILDPDVQQIAELHALAPEAIIAPRTWAIDDNDGAAVRDLMVDASGTGRKHANQYHAQLIQWQNEALQRGLRLPPTERIYFNAANEPNQGGSSQKIAEYNIAFLEMCTIHRIRATALCLGVGWPANKGPDTPVDWAPYAGIVDLIKRGDHWLELHEYNYKTGPEDGWGWLAGRHLQCPFDVRILLGEIGIDNYVDAERWRREGGNRGWQGHVEPSIYADMIERHIRGSDTRVIAALPFITDYRSNAWESFDTARAQDALLARKDNMIPKSAPRVTPTSPPITTHLPAVGTGTPPPAAPMGIIDPRVAQAILKVESGGRTHGNDGRVLIRFEAHIFRDKASDKGRVDQFFRFDASKPWTGQERRLTLDSPWLPIHTGRQLDEYDAFAMGQMIDFEAAHQSISMGAAQIMGFNHARIGYPSASAMLKAFESAPMQTIGFVNFSLSDPGLMDAIRRKDWREIARRYNGAGAVDSYSVLLEQAYNEVSQ